MGASIGTEDGTRALNVEMNIIPFIDLMSCLTAFLLVTAVWVNISSLDVSASGPARDAQDREDDAPKLSVLVDANEIWVGVSRVNDFTRIANTAAGYDWATLERTLRAHKASAFFATTDDIQVAAESTQAQPVAYQQLVLAMDVSVKAGFGAVHVADPLALYARPQR